MDDESDDEETLLNTNFNANNNNNNINGLPLPTNNTNTIANSQYNPENVTKEDILKLIDEGVLILEQCETVNVEILVICVHRIGRIYSNYLGLHGRAESVREGEREREKERERERKREREKRERY